MKILGLKVSYLDCVYKYQLPEHFSGWFSSMGLMHQAHHMRYTASCDPFSLHTTCKVKSRYASSSIMDTDKEQSVK